MSKLKQEPSSSNNLNQERQVQERPANKPMINLGVFGKLRANIKRLFDSSDCTNTDAYNSIFNHSNNV